MSREINIHLPDGSQVCTPRKKEKYRKFMFKK